jgi:5S rRNA maturation endonuclease (ribonuclease M5)
MNEDDVEVRLDDILSALDELFDINESVPILVEGKKDIDALRSLGIKGVIISYNRGKTIMNTCEELALKYAEIIILTDWDRKGGILARELKRCLESSGVRPNSEYRARLAYLCKKEIKDVESLARYIRTLSGKAKRQTLR